jgi:hypothetical protein
MLGFQGSRHAVSRAMIALGCGALAIVASGCLTDEQKADARQIALNDARFAELLAEHTYAVTDVREPRRDADEGEVIVEIAFDNSFPTSEYPGDACDIGRDPDMVTGILWLVDINADVVLAVTPSWGTVSCFDGR